MRRITIGDLARTLKKHFPLLTEDMVRQWEKAGFLITHKGNPLAQKSWSYVDEEYLPEFCRERLKMDDEQTSGVLRDLGLGFRQLSLVAS